MQIPNVEVFAEGKWNGNEFGGPDLDDMVMSFDEQNLAGKIPVKIGHTTDDTQPAQGWVTALRRVGGKLLATFDQVPQELVDEIKQGRWRHVSVELLGNVTKGGKKYRWVLDAVAVLGSARPAVDSLRGLHEMFATALPGWRIGSRVSFSRNLEVNDMSETAAELKQQLIHEIWNAAISSGQITPATREKYERRNGRDVSKYSVDDVRSWIQDFAQPAQFSRGGMATRSGGDAIETSAEPDQQLVQLTRQHIETHAKTFGHIRGYQPLTYIRAAEEVIRDPANKTVVTRYFDMHNER